MEALKLFIGKSIDARKGRGNESIDLSTNFLSSAGSQESSSSLDSPCKCSGSSHFARIGWGFFLMLLVDSIALEWASSSSSSEKGGEITGDAM